MLVGILPKFYKRAAKKVSVSEANLSTRRDLACTLHMAFHAVLKMSYSLIHAKLFFDSRS